MSWVEFKDWARETWHDIGREDRFDSWGAWWKAEVAYLKLLGLFFAGMFLVFTLCLWVLWTITYSGVWMVWVVNMVAVGALSWVASGVLSDRSNNKHMRREGWCPKCGQDVKP